MKKKLLSYEITTFYKQNGLHLAEEFPFRVVNENEFFTLGKYKYSKIPIYISCVDNIFLLSKIVDYCLLKFSDICKIFIRLQMPIPVSFSKTLCNDKVLICEDFEKEVNSYQAYSYLTINNRLVHYPYEKGDNIIEIEINSDYEELQIVTNINELLISEGFTIK